ncbi:MAG: glycosyltransferase, partial [Patescibacteria group bacterium]
QFDWMEQMAHMNQLPSCSMARREVYERSGGYRTRMKRNEDAEFWCRVTSLGFNASKVTEAVTYFHRNVDNSKGAMEWKTEGGEPDWTAWFPWRIGSSNYREAASMLKANSGEHPNPHLVPFGAQGRPKNRRFWYVHDYAYPVVSIIVTCGPLHERYLLDALDSIQAQSFPDWECIVVNDTGVEWKKDIMGAPWAKVINNAKNMGASFARNAGLPYISHHSKYVVWLDADDMWMPWYLDRMVSYAEINYGVIFSDMVRDDGDKLEYYHYPEFDAKMVPIKMNYPGSSILYPRKAIDDMWKLQKCWDVNIPGMEDWDFQVAVHSLGYCAYRVDEPLFVYRMVSSTKRESDYAKIESIRAYMDKKWHEYRKEGKEMSCGCGAKKKSSSKPAGTMSSSGNFGRLAEAPPEADDTAMVMIQYVGPVAEPFTIRSVVRPDILFRFGNNPHHSVRAVFRGDVDRLLSFSDRSGEPMYRVIHDDKSLDDNNPAAFVGKEIKEIVPG